MAEALHELFGNDKWLSEMLKFGLYIKNSNAADSISSASWTTITKTNKEDAMAYFYGLNNTSSYLWDTYETHIDKVEVDGGVEIGPKMGHPHFHLLLTINHYSYVQFDFFKMNTYLEIMFKGIETFHNFGGAKNPQKFMLGSLDAPFYDDNEHPYVDIKVYPQDNWKEVLAAYVRKPSNSQNMLKVVSGRQLPGTAETRRTEGYGA